MHTILSVHFVDPDALPITLEVDVIDIEYDDDNLLRIDDKSGGSWNFERHAIRYVMQSEVTDEEFAEMSKPQEVEEEPTSRSPSRSRRPHSR